MLGLISSVKKIARPMNTINTIALRVPHNYILPDWFQHATDREIANSLDLIGNMFSHCKNAAQMNNSLENAINEIRKAASEAVKDEAVQNLKHQVDNLIGSISNKKIENLLEVGRDAEETFESMIRSSSSTHDWKLEDTSQIPHRGDWLCNDNENTHILVEIKGGFSNQVNSVNDIQKFENDISQCLNNGYCDAAAFICMRKKVHSIPKHGHVNLSWVNNKPVLWIASQKKEEIISSLVLLRSISKNTRKQKQSYVNQEEEIIQSKIPKLANYLWLSQERITLMEKNCISTQEILAREREDLRKAIYNCEDLYDQLKCLDGVGVTNIQTIISWLTTFYNEKEREPLKKEIPKEIVNVMKRSNISMDDIKKRTKTK